MDALILLENVNFVPPNEFIAARVSLSISLSIQQSKKGIWFN